MSSQLLELQVRPYSVNYFVEIGAEIQPHSYLKKSIVMITGLSSQFMVSRKKKNVLIATLS